MAKMTNDLRDVVADMMPTPPGTVRAWVGIDNCSTGTPFVDLVLTKNPSGVDFALVKEALEEHCVILRFCSPDGLEFFEYSLNKSDVFVHVVRPNKKKLASNGAK